MTTPFQRPLDAAEVQKLLADCSYGRLITVDEKGLPVCGLVHYLTGPDLLEFHLLSDNPQLGHLRAECRAAFEVDEYLSAIPSHWVERHEGAAFTALYRLVQFSGVFELADDRPALAEHFALFLKKFQPEGGYDTPGESTGTNDRLVRHTRVRLRIDATQSRWQLAQQYPPELRRKLADRLRTRGRGNDPKAADELLRWLMLHPEEDVDPLKYE